MPKGIIGADTACPSKQSKIKKALSLFLSLALLLSTLSNLSFSSYADEEKTFLFGDVNEDGILDFNDVLLMNKFVLETNIPTDTQLYFSDVDNDGEITENDIDLVNSLRLNNLQQKDLQVYKDTYAHGYCGENVKYLLYKNGLLIIFGNGYMNDFYENSPFYKNPYVNEVIIGKDIINIGNYLFYYCENLKKVNIPDGLEIIGVSSFRGCKNLISINLPKSITSIGPTAFCYCTALDNVTIPEKVTTIQNSTFASCTKLSSINLPNNIVSIGVYAFQNTNIYNDSKNWEDGVFYIGEYLIKAKTTISKNYLIKENTSVIAEEAFRNLELESIYIPKSIKTIGEYAFYGTNKLKNVYFCDDETKWNQIDIDSGNYGLEFATINYHNWNSGRITRQATCTADGVKTYTCQNCGLTKNETISATGHNYDSNIIMYPTCTETGVKEYRCQNCSQSKTETIDAIGHDFYEYIVSPTCTREGYEKYVCAYCGYSYTGYTISPTGHSYNSQRVAPTCTSEGYTLYTCSYCNDSYTSNYVSSTGHSWNSGKITRQATCEADGVKTYTCQNCGLTKNETIPATGHCFHENNVYPTCTSYGYIGYKCCDCGCEYIDYTLPPTGHNYTTKNFTSTCTVQGYTLHTCTSCGSSYKDNYKAMKAHTNKTTTTKATTSKNGSIVTKCSACGKVSKTTVIYYPKTVSLSKRSYTYDSKAKTPTVTVKGSDGKEISNKNYTVTYSSGRKNVGKYNVKITFKGNYSGSVTKTFTIIPKSTEFSSVKSTQKGIVDLKWKKGLGINGYQIQISKKSNFAKNSTNELDFKSSSKVKTTGKLNSKKTYYFRIRTYKTVKVNGKNTKIYSAWSKTKSVKVK